MGGNPGFLRVNVETLEQFMKLGGFLSVQPPGMIRRRSREPEESKLIE